MRVWVLLRHAYQDTQVLGTYGDRPDVLESVASEHPRLLPGRWVTITPGELRLRDPRVDGAAAYNLVRSVVS